MKPNHPTLSDLAFFGLLLAILILTAGGHVVGGDEETMFRVTQNLLAGRGLAVGRGSCFRSYPWHFSRSAFCSKIKASAWGEPSLWHFSSSD